MMRPPSLQQSPLASSVLLLLACLFIAPARAQGVDRDPLEPINRAIFAFNDGADAAVVRPLSAFYDKVTPRPARTGIRNFFGNIDDFNAVINATLQGRLVPASRSAGRVLINTSLGFFGLFDVATDMGIEKYQTDFGHTLALWGVPDGPYVMLPLLGPRTARSTVGTGVDGFVSPAWQTLSGDLEWPLRGLQVVDGRASLLGTDQLVSGDRYLFIRDVYLQSRDSLTNDGQSTDTFSEFEDDWEVDDF